MNLIVHNPLWNHCLKAIVVNPLSKDGTVAGYVLFLKEII